MDEPATPHFNTKWVPAADALIERDWAAGSSAADIAKRLAAELGIKKTRCAVIGRVHRLGLTQTTKQKASPPTRVAPAPRLTPPRPKPVAVPALRGVQDQAVIDERASPVPETARPLDDLARHQCRFPVGNAVGHDMLYCGAAKAPGDKAYCAGHRRVSSGASQPPPLMRNGKLPLFARQ